MMNLTEAARYCGVHPATITRWTAQGLLPRDFEDGRRVFRAADLDNMKRPNRGRPAKTS
jgi:DNA-binding transcriptional MerR regulator